MRLIGSGAQRQVFGLGPDKPATRVQICTVELLESKGFRLFFVLIRRLDINAALSALISLLTCLA